MSKFYKGQEVVSTGFTTDEGKIYVVLNPEPDYDGDIQLVQKNQPESKWFYRSEDYCHAYGGLTPTQGIPTCTPTKPIAVPTATPEAYLNQEGNSQMAKTTRNLVSVVLIDEDAGLDVSKSLVKDFGSFVREGSDNELIQEILMDTKHNVESALRGHNAVRVKEVDLDILQRTGNSAKLREVKLKDLTWKVVSK